MRLNTFDPTGRFYMYYMKEDPEEAYLSPHHRYFAERYERRRVRSRFGLLFIFFGLGVSVLMILAAVMLFSLIGSIAG